ncbi:Retrovirus-related Pol polyprotein from transposon TNT 1-94 [Gossypium australe]|uniref:Retrovirus-related Pol polyprotein from transposon TNT 1-94 n=1 Tax=Gossypium australe TaxID=47621 RepID=A0A5B6WYC7_9ROSI|nr:Retrovirus-related Pol polyprotein from transposon TNT 1-94 [Gossypium australe]
MSKGLLTLVYGFQDTNLSLVGYSDADWVGCVDDRKTTFRACFYAENNLVSWYNKKQNYISLFTAKT